jgi:hypothetical protein
VDRTWSFLQLEILLPSEALLLSNKTRAHSSRLRLLLKIFQYAVRFPLSMQEVPTTATSSGRVLVTWELEQRGFSARPKERQHEQETTQAIHCPGFSESSD